jgi:uncharacterized protein GlcG (DUF336 family)
MKNQRNPLRLGKTGVRFPALVLLLSAALASASVLASKKNDDDLPTAQLLTLELALKAAVEAESFCAQQGYRVSVAVVDRGGLVKAHIRGDGSGPHTLESARKKAYTSASLGRPTSLLVDVVVSNPATEGLRDMNESILILGGGLPIVADESIIGGIGVGGAPGGDLDEECAQAGIDRIAQALD